MKNRAQCIVKYQRVGEDEGDTGKIYRKMNGTRGEDGEKDCECKVCERIELRANI